MSLMLPSTPIWLLDSSSIFASTSSTSSTFLKKACASRRSHDDEKPCEDPAERS